MFSKFGQHVTLQYMTYFHTINNKKFKIQHSFPHVRLNMKYKTLVSLLFCQQFDKTLLFNTVLFNLSKKLET